MKNIILLTKDIESYAFEHAIELAITMQDMEIEVGFVITLDLYKRLCESYNTRAKKILQLKLFEVRSFILDTLDTDNLKAQANDKTISKLDEDTNERALDLDKLSFFEHIDVSFFKNLTLNCNIVSF